MCTCQFLHKLQPHFILSDEDRALHDAMLTLARGVPMQHEEQLPRVEPMPGLVFVPVNNSTPVKESTEGASERVEIEKKKSCWILTLNSLVSYDHLDSLKELEYG